MSWQQWRVVFVAFRFTRFRHTYLLATQTSVTLVSTSGYAGGTSVDVLFVIIVFFSVNNVTLFIGFILFKKVKSFCLV